MKTRIIIFLCMMSFYNTFGWGQSWPLSETMTAVIEDNILTVSTTLAAEEMPDFDWLDVPWYDDRDLIHSVVIADRVTRVGELTFIHCAYLTSVTLSNSVTSIGKWAFYNCYNLPSITIPEGVTILDHAAFKLCSALTEIEIPASVSYIGGEMFIDCLKLETIHVHADNTVYSSVDGVLYNKEKTTLIIYPQGKNVATFEIPGTVTIIEDGSFYGASFESVTIPNSVTEIGTSAFESCTGLTSITIPNSVTVIGPSAFKSCTQLTSLTIPVSVKEIGEFAFDNCAGLTEVTVEWETPLEVLETIFNNVNTSEITLYVPTGRAILYEDADVWMDFGTIEEYAFSNNDKIGVATLNAYASNGVLYITGLMPGKPLYVYSISGQLLYSGMAKAEEEQLSIAWRGVCVVVAGTQCVKVNGL